MEIRPRRRYVRYIVAGFAQCANAEHTDCMSVEVFGRTSACSRTVATGNNCLQLEMIGFLINSSAPRTTAVFWEMRSDVLKKNAAAGLHARQSPQLIYSKPHQPLILLDMHGQAINDDEIVICPIGPTEIDLASL